MLAARVSPRRTTHRITRPVGAALRWSVSSAPSWSSRAGAWSQWRLRRRQTRAPIMRACVDATRAAPARRQTSWLSWSS